MRDAEELRRWFGGSAARQRAESWAEEHGGCVIALDRVARSKLRAAGLNPFYRDAEGTQYSHGVLQARD